MKEFENNEIIRVPKPNGITGIRRVKLAVRQLLAVQPVADWKHQSKARPKPYNTVVGCAQNIKKTVSLPLH